MPGAVLDRAAAPHPFVGRPPHPQPPEREAAMTNMTSRGPASAVPQPHAHGGGDGGGHPRHDVGLVCLPSSATRARRTARTTVERWGLPAELVADVELVTCELVTNAIRHSGAHNPKEPGHCRLALERPTPDTVRIEVTDRSPARPVKREPGESETGGRGLALVEALALDWGVTLRPVGKSVWAVLRART
ncbi:ATP-binding protein [Streptomyces antibioticus]|uniref:ATP-binding protein n=1 Tax=Streptomyces antibioticus TaxID=1890 RepID=UPI003717A61A